MFRDPSFKEEHEDSSGRRGSSSVKISDPLKRI